jgi:hypothetical protein
MRVASLTPAAVAAGNAMGLPRPRHDRASLKLVSLYLPLRVDKQSEFEGLDVTQHGEALQ